MSSVVPAASSPPARAPLIAFEGIDGSGTTTQAKLLHDWLVAHGVNAHLTAEPSSGGVGTMIRRCLRGETPLERAPLALLFAADRLDHLASDILPRLRAGQLVITDRYVYSSLAYQSLDLDADWVSEINALAPEPDLTIYLRLDPRAALQRIAARGESLEIFETQPQQDRVSRRYDELLGVAGGSIADPRGSMVDPRRILRDPRGSGAIHADPAGSTARRIAVIDGARTRDTVHAEVLAAYRALGV